MTTCAGCEYLTHINRGTIPRTLCKRYRKPAIGRCIDYQVKTPVFLSGKTEKEGK